MIVKETSNSDEQISHLHSENSNAAVSGVDKAYFLNEYFVSISTRIRLDKCLLQLVMQPFPN